MVTVAEAATGMALEADDGEGQTGTSNPFDGAAPEPDSDADGLPDAWEQRYSGTPTGMSPTADQDGDGLNNLQEFWADTNPTNWASVLKITGTVPRIGSNRVDWKGGTGVWQYLERRYDLLATGAAWKTIFTNPPPTSVSTNVTDIGTTNPTLFHRIRADRP